jgi:hypothetical protein
MYATCKLPIYCLPNLLLQPIIIFYILVIVCRLLFLLLAHTCAPAYALAMRVRDPHLQPKGSSCRSSVLSQSYPCRMRSSVIVAPKLSRVFSIDIVNSQDSGTADLWVEPAELVN